MVSKHLVTRALSIEPTMSLRCLALLFFCWSAINVATQGVAEAKEFVVVVSSQNQVSGSNDQLRRLLRDLYLGRLNTWPDGVKYTALARPDSDAGNQVFANVILHTSLEELQTYWSIVPEARPRSVEGLSELVGEVAKDPGAFAVLSHEELVSLSPDVRVLLEFDDSDAIPPEVTMVETFVQENEDQVLRDLTMYVRRQGAVSEISFVQFGRASDLHKFTVLNLRQDGAIIRLVYTWVNYGAVFDHVYRATIKDNRLNIIARLPELEAMLKAQPKE